MTQLCSIERPYPTPGTVLLNVWGEVCSEPFQGPIHWSKTPLSEDETANLWYSLFHWREKLAKRFKLTDEVFSRHHIFTFYAEIPEEML